MELGYAISSEEHRPLDLVRNAARAEECGFTFALVSDHFHPWTDRQGQSPFVWSVLGGIGLATERLVVGTGVTCPTIRIHPAIIAQAAATAASMLPGRFFLGVGHGREPQRARPRPAVARDGDQARDARGGDRGDARLWRGRADESPRPALHRGECAHPPARRADRRDGCGGGPAAAELAGRVGDGLVATAPAEELLGAFDNAGGDGKPRYGQVTVCWAEDERRRGAPRTVVADAALQGPLGQELPLPSHFEEAAAMVSEEDVAQAIVCGPDADAHAAAIDAFADAGYTHVYVHQVGPDQEGFFRFYEAEILPRYAGVPAGARRA